MDYSVAKFINGVGIVAGWLLLGLGAISFFIVAQSDVPTAMLVAGVSVASGLVLVAICQMANATIHTAEESKETNVLLRRLLQSDGQSVTWGNRSGSYEVMPSSPSSGQSNADSRPKIRRSSSGHPVVESYKSFEIEKVDGLDRFVVGGRYFMTLAEAKKHIDRSIG